MSRRAIAAAVLIASALCGESIPASAQTQTPQAPAQLPPLPVTQLDQGQVTLDSPRRLTLTFAAPQPIHDVLDLLVRGTPFSLAVEPDADGMFTGELKQLTLRQALATLLSPLGLDFSVQGTVISVFRRRPETRVFDLDVLNVKRGWQRRIGRAANGSDGTLAADAPADDVFDGIGAGIRSLLSEEGDVHIDRVAGVATVTDFTERLDRVASYLETLHTRSSREVRLQARLLEVVLNDGASVDWRAVRDKLGLPRESADAGLGADVDAVQGAIAAQGSVTVLSAPDVIALNNEPAIVRAGTPGEALLTLTVIPQVSADGLIQLSISPSWDERADKQPSKRAPVMRATDIDTVARVRDGNTVPLSGLLRSHDVMKKTNGFSALFSAQQHATAHAETIVLIRATVVTPAAPAAGSRP